MDFILIVSLAVLTFITRVINLLKIPIFTDEAIYIRWAQIGLADPAHRFISLSDGKQPLITWLMYPFLLLFKDPLFAGRFVSVLSSVLAVIGIYLLAKTLFNRTAAVMASILYIIFPMSVVYDRLALMDSLLAAFSIWSLYLEVLLVKYIRLDVSLLLGITIGLGYLTKSSALFFLIFLPVSLLLFDFHQKSKVKKLFQWGGLALLSTIIAQIMYNSLRLSPLFYIIEQKNYSFIMTPAQFLEHPFRLILPNLRGLTGFLFSYATIPFMLLVIIGLLLAIFGKKPKLIFLFICFFIPFSALSAFGIVLFPRFILFMTMPLLVVVAKVLSDFYNFAKKKVRPALLLIPLILIYPAYNSFLLITNPVKAAIPQIDRNQLFNDWPSGYGVKEVVAFIGKQAEKGKVVIGTEGTFGLNPAVYEIYLKQNTNVIIRGFWPVKEVPGELLDFAKRYPTYLVFKDTQDIPLSWPLKQIAKYRRGDGKTYLYFYQVIPNDQK